MVSTHGVGKSIHLLAEMQESAKPRVPQFLRGHISNVLKPCMKPHLLMFQPSPTLGINPLIHGPLGDPDLRSEL
jgi:hypothetical protein